MKRHTTALTIGFGCILLAISGCTSTQLDTANQISTGCAMGSFVGDVIGAFNNPAYGLLGCAASVTTGVIGNIENRYNSILEPTTAEPTVVRWDVTYAPLPTPGDNAGAIRIHHAPKSSTNVPQ